MASIFTHIYIYIYILLYLYLCLCLCLYSYLYLYLYLFLYLYLYIYIYIYGATSLHPPPPPLVVWCGVVVGCGFQRLTPFPPPCGVLVGVGSPAPSLWCGWWSCLGFRCIDMKGFRVEGQQTETRPIQVSVATLDMPRSCIASKTQHSRESRVRGAHPCDCWHF